MAAGLAALAAPGLPASAAGVQDRPSAPGPVLPALNLGAAAEPALEPAPVRIGGKPADSAHSTPCVVVDIAGERAGHLDCATQALTEAARIAQREAQASRDVSVAQAGSPDLEVGVASRSGTRLRLRENFGVSIRPPAVSAPVSTNPMGRRP
ncbi:hypothetical protein L6Q21_16445 [Sandaracinobacter sp. RS1-74]|uniref:hypothetical protein n=1 Tax=Sandaracinobacteroides sayramensis TaxID=2913411 RepID=UPI001EDADE60|nr:hypothetical protein [Sandaracinobacteroides sayramensis]MCG2842566.1 hypothetical protein [Sandaracinobacteroides sayramensis]